MLAAIGVGEAARSAPVDVVFQLNQPASNLNVDIEARGFSDDDTQNLTGTVNARLDLGTSGSFPAAASLTFTDAAVSSVAPFEMRLGFPRPFPGADVVATGIVARLTTPSPPGVMNLTATPATYRFDASQFTLVVDQGTITTSGFVDDTQNLAEEPVEGASAPGTFGSLTFSVAGASGPYTLVNAALNFPIQISELTEFGNPPEEVQIDLTGTVAASAKFYVALAPISGDFTQDGRVDDLDFAAWRNGFGKATGATLSEGDANGDGDVDGADFLVWQRNRGLAPPSVTGFVAAPEPASSALALLAAMSAIRLVAARRNAPRVSPPCDPRD